MSIELILIIIFLVGLAFVIGLWLWLWRKLASVNIRLTDSPITDKSDIKNEDKQKGYGEIEKTKLVVHGLLKNLETHVQNLLDDATIYGSNLDEHASQLKKAETLATIQQVERLLLQEVETMKNSTNRYQQQLDDAQKKLKEQEQVLEKLSRDANTDFLTQVNNRAAFDKRLNEEFTRYKRYGHTFSIILMDLDHFKDVNDTYGHLAGDRVLRAVASLLNDEKRASDFLARYGGEEFALILPGIDANSALVVADKLRKKVETTTFRYENYSIHTSLSAGITTVLPEDQTPTDVLKRADDATYEAKNKGRNQVIIK
ncbi:MAG: GGDEF domain-containing protein [Candidatus Hydrogenedens sp.]